MSFDTIENIINGKFENLPDLKKKSVRIFISSTFTDTNDERDYLIENIYPKLREYCKSKYELDFQTVDMRWGVPSDSYENHGTTELCLKEIESCRTLSIGPNFVAILGNKYGKRPLAHKIKSTEFEILMEELKDNLSADFSLSLKEKTDNNDVVECHIDNIFLKCFKLDTNETPNHYRLLPISQVIKEYASPIPQLKEIGNKFWNAVESRLCELLHLGAHFAFQKGHLNTEEFDRYFVSTTEKEIYNGILSINNPNKSALCFIREIDNISDCVDDKRASRFIDVKTINGKRIIDIEAQKLLDDLKHTKIPSKLDQKNIFTYHVKWKDNRIENIEESLEVFGQVFYEQLVRLIDESINSEYLLTESNYEKFISTTHSGKIRDKVKRIREQIIKMSKLDSINNSNHLDRFTNVAKLSEIRLEFKNVLQETMSHATQYVDTISKFFGRDDLMIKIKNYILSDSKTPFIVTGESGCGKTNVMAITAAMVRSWVPNPEDYTVVIRFLGTSMDSSTIYKTYSSVALQLHFLNAILMEKNNFKDAVNQNQASYERYYKSNDLASLIAYLQEQFERTHVIDPKRKIVLILDSLDQLAPADYTNINQWLLVNLPSHVKLVLSTISDHANLLEMVRKKIEKEIKASKHRDKKRTTEMNMRSIDDKINEIFEKQTLHIQKLSVDLSKLILSNWLAARHKNLSNEQWSYLTNMFNHAILLPLYLKLVFDIVIHWRSFDMPDDEFLKCFIVDDLILYLFHRMEQVHGKTIFSRAICYMTVCKNGITESELEDILSLDDDVLFAVFQYHIPPVRRLPAILWLRIRNELHEYVVEREANDAKVIYWYHRRFIEVSLKQYVSSLTDNEIVFQNILDFYNETWKDKQKPFKINDYLQRKLGLNNSEATGDRYISSQPIEYYGNDGQVHYNKRKLVELPNCLANLSSNIAIEKACELVFFNYEFMHAKFKCYGLGDVVEDLKNIMALSAFNYGSKKSNKNYEQLKILEKIFMIAGDVIEDYPDSLAYQIVSRMVLYYGENKYLTNFIDECDKLSIKHCAFVSPYTQMTPPGGVLVRCINRHHAPITHVVLLVPLMISLSINKIHISDADKFYTLYQMELPKLKVLDIQNTDNVYSLFKVIVNKKEYNQETFKTKDNYEVGGENLPLTFILKTKYLVYLITASKEIKFKYIADRSRNNEILDIFCILNKMIVIVEKNSSTIKVFSDYLNSPTVYTPYQLYESQIVNLFTCSYPLIKTDEFHFWFYLQFSDNQLKKITITDRTLKEAEFNDYLDEDSESSDSDSDSDFKYKDNEYKKIFEGCSTTKLSNEINLYTFDGMLPQNLDIKSMCLRNYNSSKFYRAALYKELKQTESEIYLSFEDGTFIISVILQKTKETKFYIFKSALKEPAKSIKAGVNDFVFTIQTENYLYLLHKTNQEHHENSKYRLKDFKDEKFCFIELESNYDCVLPISNVYFIASRFGLIELFKVKCLKNAHTFKTLMTINAHNGFTNELLYLYKYTVSTSYDGLLSVWQFDRVKAQNFLSDFDRTESMIIKLLVSRSYGMTVSINNDLAFWDLSTGKLLKTVKTTSPIKQLEFSQDESYVVILLENDEIHLYSSETFMLVRKLAIALKNNPNLVLIKNRDNTQTNSENKPDLYGLDINNIKLYELKIKANDHDNDEITHQESINPVLIDYNHVAGQSDFVVVFYLKEIENIILINKDFKKYKIVKLKDDRRAKSGKATNLYDIDYEHKEDHESLVEYLTEAKAKLKYKVLNAHLNMIMLSIQSMSTLSVLVKAKVEKSDLPGHRMKFIIQKVYFGCENVFSNGKAVAYYVNSQNTKNKKDDSKQESKILVKKFLIREKYVFKLDEDVDVHLICVDSNVEYLAFNDERKLIYLYRLKDSKMIANILLHDVGINLNFSLDSRFVCLTTNDRRVLSLLIVDPEVPEHSNRIKELPSRHAVNELPQMIEQNKKGRSSNRKTSIINVKRPKTKREMLEKMGATEIVDSSDNAIYSSGDEVDNQQFNIDQSELEGKKDPKVKIMEKKPITPIYKIYKHKSGNASWINEIKSDFVKNKKNGPLDSDDSEIEETASDIDRKVNFFKELKASLLLKSTNDNLFNRNRSARITRTTQSSACNIS